MNDILNEYEKLFLVNLDLMCISDINGKLIKTNKVWETILGYSENEMNPKVTLHLYDFIHPDDLTDTVSVIKKLKSNENTLKYINRCRKSNGTYCYIEWQSYFYNDLVYSSGRDITESLNIQCELKERESNFKTFFETVDDIIVVGTLEGKILYSNKALTEKLGFLEEELKNMHVLELHPAEYRKEAENIFAAMFRGEKDYCPIPLTKKDGSYLPVETRVWFGKWGSQDCIYGISKDLSIQQAALEKFYKLFDNNPALMAVSSLTDRKFIDVNNAFLNKLGYTKSQIIGKTSNELNLFVENESHQKVFEMLKREGRIKDVEMKVRKCDGQIITGLFSGEIIDNQIDKCLLTVMTDITESKKMEAILMSKEVLLSTIPKATYELMLNQDLYTAIEKGFALLGEATGIDRIYLFENYYDKESGDGFSNHKLEWCSADVIPQIDNPELQNVPFKQNNEFFDPLIKGEPFIKLIRDIKNNDTKEALSSQNIISIAALPVHADDKFWGFIGFDDCKYERVWSEAEYSILMIFAASISAVIEKNLIESRLKLAIGDIKTALIEKEVLLKEIHHRVKNNLQIISSLLYLQAIQTKDREAFKVLVDSENRVKAMSIIHEMMYQTENLSSINFEEYIRNLVRYLLETHKKETLEINVIFDIANIQLSIDRGIPCGLMLNELISNSLKHAFPKRNKGEIKIIMNEDQNNMIHLVVADNGKGMDSITYKKSVTLGLQLVNKLTGQLKATISIENDNGTKTTVVFSKYGYVR